VHAYFVLYYSYHRVSFLPLLTLTITLIPFLFLIVPAPTEIYTLSLHDALPISARATRRSHAASRATTWMSCCRRKASTWRARDRSEEHTSELQSRENLVCRLLLEKKKKISSNHNIYVTM